MGRFTRGARRQRLVSGHLQLIGGLMYEVAAGPPGYRDMPEARRYRIGAPADQPRRCPRECGAAPGERGRRT